MPVGVEQILVIQAQVEELDFDEESLAYLGDIGQQTSLRSVFRSFYLLVCCLSEFFYIHLLFRLLKLEMIST